MKICPTCNGARRVKLAQGWWDKLLRNPADTETCHFCNGIGEVAESTEEEQQRLARQGEFQRTHNWAQRSTEPEQRAAAAEETRNQPSDDSPIAKELHALLHLLAISTRTLHDQERRDNQYYKQITLIGEQLNKDGGFARMLRVGNLVKNFGKEAPTFVLLRDIWTGIGQWPGVKRNPRDGQVYVLVPAGRFQMGHESDVFYTAEDERPVHSVTITHGFWVGQTPVTWRTFKEVTDRDQMLQRVFEEVRRKNYSVENAVTCITWDEARQYSEIVGMRLPTEAEWEWAARGSMPTMKVGLDYRPMKVGQQQPNPYGLHDMLGNVLHWVSDWYGPYDSMPQTDPQGPGSGDCRVVRGGSRMSSTRYKSAPEAREGDIGFRCVSGSL